MGILRNVTVVQSETKGQPATVSAPLDVGKTLAVVILAVVFVIAAVVLFIADKTSAAWIFVNFTTLLVSGGLGISIGEKSGAQQAASGSGGG
jgi:hypothetical protein